MDFRTVIFGLLHYLADFCRETTFHGLIYLVTPRRHWLEKALWAFLILLSVFGSCWIVTSTWYQYINNPIIISLVKDFNEWSINFPAITICLEDRFNETKAKEIISRVWKVNESQENFNYYMGFVRIVANSSLLTDTLKDFKNFSDDSTLKDINLLDIAVNVSTSLSMINLNDKMFPFYWVATELGVCQSGMGKLVNNLALMHFPGREKEREDSSEKCSIKNTDECVAVMKKFPSPLNVYIHSTYEIPTHFSSHDYHLGKMMLDVNKFEVERFLSSLDVKALRPSQRRCHFYEEKVFKEIPYYSFNLCDMQCRKQAIFRDCKCVPHFYNKLANQPTCDSKGLVCVASNLEKILENTKSGGPDSCNCYPVCEEWVYNIVYTENGPGYWPDFSTLTVKQSAASKTRYQREVIFQFSDLLVSFGGTAALFLGCSVISGVELLYFFTIKLFKFLVLKTPEERTNFRKKVFERATRLEQQLTKIHTDIMY